MMNSFQRAVADPPLEIIMHGALGRQILGDCTPLAAGAEDIHNPVNHFANVNRSLVAARLGRRDYRPDFGPLRIRQIARIAQMAAVVPITVLLRPHPVLRIDAENQRITADSAVSTPPSKRLIRLNLMPDGHLGQSRPDTKATDSDPAGGTMGLLLRLGRGIMGVSAGWLSDW